MEIEIMKKGKLVILVLLLISLFISLNNTSAYFISSTSYNNEFKTENYNINLEGNGGIFSTSNLSINKDNLILPKPTKNGYDFLGYSNVLNGNAIYSLNTKASIINDKTIYAKWSPTNYSINYELNGGTNNSNNPTSYNIETNTFSILNPTKTNFVFKGWSGDNTTISKGSTGNKSYTANWTENYTEFWIKYNSSGGSWNGGQTEFTQYYKYLYNSNKVSMTNNGGYDGSNPSRKGWHFNGWNPNPSSSNHSNQTAYAQWKDDIAPVFGSAYLSYIGPGTNATNRYYKIQLDSFIEEGSGLNTHCWFLHGTSSWDCMNSNQQIDRNGRPYEYGNSIRCNANHTMDYYFIDNAGNRSITGTIDFYVPCN
jgi:uncharacterized repeat protein (TIGR02543 family)